MARSLFPSFSRWNIGPSVEYLAKTAGWLWDKGLSEDGELNQRYLEWFTQRKWRAGIWFKDSWRINLKIQPMPRKGGTT